MISNKDILKMINSKLGEGSLFTFEGEETVKVQPVPTGVPSLDYALGIGGWPWGRIIEIYGPESSGKTTIALKTAATFQQLSLDPSHPFYGKKVAFIDAEHALDPLHAKAVGVDISKEGMFISQPNSGEQAYDLIEALILSGHFGFIVVDSLPSLIPQKIIDGSAEENFVGLQARLNSQCIPKIANIAAKNNTTVLFINQIREKVGVLYGNPETTPGGRALKFYASVRAEVRRKEIRQKDTIIGQQMTVRIIKNKVFRPFTVAEFDYYWDTGIDTVKDIMNVAIQVGVIKQAGAYYFIGHDIKQPAKDANGNELKWRGKETLLEVLRNSPALFQYINDLVMGHIPKDAQIVVETSSEEDTIEEKMDQQETLL